MGFCHVLFVTSDVTEDTQDKVSTQIFLVTLSLCIILAKLNLLDNNIFLFTQVQLV